MVATYMAAAAPLSSSSSSNVVNRSLGTPDSSLSIVSSLSDHGLAARTLQTRASNPTIREIYDLNGQLWDAYDRDIRTNPPHSISAAELQDDADALIWVIAPTLHLLRKLPNAYIDFGVEITNAEMSNVVKHFDDIRAVLDSCKGRYPNIYGITSLYCS
ncbi:MAG: hypothetical protein M1829_006203 [Trizodia sp. TS-e1964]|nr:MAG: hypothetical protein M1829_006203 [Trizodia sp. TS-e1964]